MQTPQYKMIEGLMERIAACGRSRPASLPTPETVKALTLQNLKDYYAKTYRPDLTTIVVVGDITPEKAKAAVERYFGQWKAQGPKPDVISKPIPVNPAGYAAVDNPYASQDTVLMGQA
jgi:zinc protease